MSLLKSIKNGIRLNYPVEYDGKIVLLEDILEKAVEELLKRAKAGESIVPEPHNVLRALSYIKYPSVVIIGQDPYPDKNLATGIAFGVPKGSKIPTSLRIIFRELAKEYPNADLKEGLETLEHWATQEVLLLNTALTVAEGKPGSHFEIWSEFVKQLVKVISDSAVNNDFKPIVFVLLGKQAKNLIRPVINEKIHYVIERHHPAAEAYGGKNKFEGFYREVNELLKQTNQEIQWV